MRGDEPSGNVADERDRPAAPRVLGADRMRAALHQRLFGEASPSPAEAGGKVSTQVTPLDSVRAQKAADDNDPDLLGRIGRFELQGRLGAGGMGVVYRAHDPELDRVVAIKLLRSELTGDAVRSNGASRLQREAQAMARLNHPNVVTVHEVGTFRDRIFVAMELVQGVTLRQWLGKPGSRATIANGRVRGRSWDHVLPPFLQAAAGLAAAHRAGIVHRDFKPDNVMIDGDGRVRVLDFGLARSTGNDPLANHTWPDSIEISASMGSRDGESSGSRRESGTPTVLTRTGAIMGTPAYMAPEQHLGAPADARSDQFSFCVALYEGLYGERPFAGGSYPELAANVTHGLRSPRPRVAVPRAIVRAIERGLSLDASDRFASMDDLRRALELGSRRRRGGIALAGATALATAMAVLVVRQPDASCDDAARTLEGVWDAPRRERLATTFTQLGTSTAGPITASTEALLDAYAARLVDHTSELCAARTIGHRNAAELAQRSRCLDERRAELGGLVDLLLEGQREALFEAVQGAAMLSDVSACADPRRLGAWAEPRTPEAIRELATARTELARARALGLLGRHDEAVARAADVARVARDHGDLATEASATYVHGQFQERQGHVRAAEDLLRHAVALAERVEAHEVRALALTRLVWVVGLEPARYDEAVAVAADARAVLRVLGSDPLLQASLDANLGSAAWRAGHVAVALEHHTAALALFERLYGPDHPHTARSRSSVGMVLSLLGRHDEAQAQLERARVVFEATLGPKHPFLAIALGSIASDLTRQERYDEAAAVQARALAIHEHNGPAGHMQVLRNRFNLAHTLYLAGRHAEAEHQLREAEPWLEGAELTHGARKQWLLLRAFVAVHRERYADADRLLTAAEALDPDDVDSGARFYRVLVAMHEDWHEARRLANAERERLMAERDPDELALAKIRGLLGIVDSVITLARANP